MAATQPMSHWARPRAASTDHWSKLKAKSYYHTQTSTGNYVCYCRPLNLDPHGMKYSRRPSEMLSSMIPLTSSYHPTKNQGLKTLQTNKPTLARVGSSQLNQQLAEMGSLQLPSAQQWLSETRLRKRSPSATSRRARRGFVYWPRDTTQPSATARKTFGARETFLGI